MSQGFGMTKQPASWSWRKRRTRSAVSGMTGAGAYPVTEYTKSVAKGHTCCPGAAQVGVHEAPVMRAVTAGRAIGCPECPRVPRTRPDCGLILTTHGRGRMILAARMMGRGLRILHLEDNPADAELIRSL